ncbi:MAG: hypothetical protein FWD36_07040 [Treponema sp.]|nr:hypothetical protein [Treponema sp.]
MGNYFQILIFLTIGIVLLWFGYSLFTGQLAGMHSKWKNQNQRYRLLPTRRVSLTPGDPQSCPLCSIKLQKGELVKTHAYPSITGGKDRLMHIKGCIHCIDGEVKRRCPVCHKPLSRTQFLVARIFERSHKRNHVHILGCCKCRRHGNM